MKQQAPPAGVKVIAKLMHVIECLAQENTPVSLGQIYATTSIPKPTAYRIVQSLKKLGYVFQDPVTQEYQLAGKFRSLSSQGSTDTAITALCREPMQRLLEKFGETVNLGVAEGASVRYIEVLASSQPLRMSVPLGHRSPIYATAIGKSVLAFMDPEKVRERINGLKMRTFTKKTIASPDQLKKSFEKIREQGYAVDEQEYSNECFCIAAPVLIPGAEPRYGISVSIPATRMKPERVPEIGRALALECKKISAKAV